MRHLWPWQSRQHVPWVSIHASARDATHCIHERTTCHIRFNPRIREGCDSLSATVLVVAVLFQSTHPRGMRRVRPRRCLPTRSVSIHASARDATQEAVAKIMGTPMFQSTHPRGMRHFMTRYLDLENEVSIHASARDATCCRRCPSKAWSGFNPRIREGCDQAQQGFFTGS